MDMVWLGNGLGNATEDTLTTAIPITDPRRCLHYHVASSCARISILFSVAVVTLIICVIRAIQSHCYHSTNYHHYVVYYSTGILACILAVNWMIVDTVVIDILATFLLAIELLIVCNFYGSLAARILSQERVFKFVVFPSLFVILLYFVALLLWAFIKQKDEHTECTAPHWIQFSTSQLVLAQLFLLSAIYITRKLNMVLTTNTNRLIKKLQLWGLVAVFELSSTASFVYDLVLELTNGSNHNCDTPFTYNEIAAIFVYIIHKMVKYFLPVWVMLAVFSPTRQRMASHDNNEDTSSWPSDSRPRGKFLRTDVNEYDKLLYDVTTTTSSSASSYQSLDVQHCNINT